MCVGCLSRRLDPAPHVANLRIEMISGGSLACADQKRLHARIEHKAGFFALVEVQLFERFDHPTVFVDKDGKTRSAFIELNLQMGLSVSNLKIKGSQGSWEVSTRFGKLPCVHQYYWRVDEHGPYYHDPRAIPDGYAHGAKFEKHIALIRSAKKVVLTEDVINKNHSEGADGFFSRVDYVGIFEIDDVTLDDDGLQFRFVRRLQ